MSDPWRCAVCEGTNDGGTTTCATCGASITETTSLSRRAAEAEPTTPRSGRGSSAQGQDTFGSQDSGGDAQDWYGAHGDWHGRGDRPATDDLGRAGRVGDLRPDEVYVDAFGNPVDVDGNPLGWEIAADYPRDPYEVSPRPRVRFVGCCLPLTLGLALIPILLVLGTVIAVQALWF